MYSELLDRIEAYLEQREDVRDGSDRTPLPNEAMDLLMRLREARRETPRHSTEAGALTCPWAMVGTHLCREAFTERVQGKGSKKLRFPIGDPRNKPEDDPYEIEQRAPQSSES